MVASFLSLFSLPLYISKTSERKGEERGLCFRLYCMSKRLRALKWLPSANQNESCCGKFVREIKRVSAGRHKGMKEVTAEVLISKHSAIVVH